MGNCCCDRKDTSNPESEDKTIEPQLIDIKLDSPLKYQTDTLPIPSLNSTLEY